MSRYVAIRIVLLAPILIGVSLVVFLTLNLIPGDPALAILGPYATETNIAELRKALGLDQPLPQRYLLWLSNLLHGDLGWSYSLNRPVWSEIVARLPATFLLASAALCIFVAAGLFAGIASVGHRGWRRRLAELAPLIAISVPPFWLGLMLILVFSVRLGWFPSSGMTADYAVGGVGDIVWHLMLPAVTLAVTAAGVTARLARVYMSELLANDFVRVARAKGLQEDAVLWRHVLRNAMVKLLPVIGTQIGYILGGTIYVETIFQWPGIGRMLVDGILSRDILLVQGGVLVMTVAYVVLNLLIDLGQRALDPRISQ